LNPTIGLEAMFDDVRLKINALKTCPILQSEGNFYQCLLWVNEYDIIWNRTIIKLVQLNYLFEKNTSTGSSLSLHSTLSLAIFCKQT